MIQIDFTTKPEYVIDKWGYKRLCDENGNLHSYNDLPACVSINGAKYWYKHGLLHRNSDLPAYIGSNGIKEYWVNGKRINK